MIWYCSDCGTMNNEQCCKFCKATKLKKVHEYECKGDCSGPEKKWIDTKNYKGKCPTCGGELTEIK